MQEILSARVALLRVAEKEIERERERERELK